MLVTFVADIKPLFRPRDIGAMKRFADFDLSKYEDVVIHADNILTRLRDGDMPCDGAWPPEKITLFAQWISDGKLENPPSPPPAPEMDAAAAPRAKARPKKKPKKTTKTKTKKTTKKKATKTTKKKTTTKKKKARARRGSA